jgi:uncharacterized protein YndB with AHSA1/START domain
MRRLVYLLVLAPLCLQAELTRQDDYGFEVEHTIVTASKPFVVYRTLTAHIDQWWSGDHSWSGDAANLYMEVGRGGCFCERLPGGGRVEHLRILYFAPGSELRFDGALGPLQTLPVQGRMIWKITDDGEGSRVTFNYKVFGHPIGGLTGIASAVDSVIGEQIQRLSDRLDRG